MFLLFFLSRHQGTVIRNRSKFPILIQDQETTILNYAFKFAMVDSFAELIPSFEAEIDHTDFDPNMTIPNFNDTVYTQL